MSYISDSWSYDRQDVVCRDIVSDWTIAMLLCLTTVSVKVDSMDGCFSNLLFHSLSSMYEAILINHYTENTCKRN